MFETGWILAAYAVLACLAWCILYLRTAYKVLHIPLFEKEDPPVPEHWPRLSVVVAARDEADTIEQAASTLLGQDYPELEIIMVNDRSTDETGRIIREIARREVRVKAVHVEHLPEGWLGKVHALHLGTEKSSGEWILYTDADVHFRQGTLRRAVALALAREADHLCLMPEVRTGSFCLGVVMSAFKVLFAWTTRIADAGKPGSRAVVGAGAFNMVRRAALEKTEGFQWLRMEVGDDLGLGLMLSRSGAKSHFAIAQEHLGVTWYPSLGAMFRGMEKNLFGVGARYSLARMSMSVLLLWALVPAPLVAFLYTDVPWLRFFGAAACLSLGLFAAAGKIRFRSGMLHTLLAPAGQLVISLMMLRSGILCTLRGGILWRGTRYKTGDLRAGQQLKL
jgi:glycosyltransferase involved in cell wall biosynthesis